MPIISLVLAAFSYKVVLLATKEHHRSRSLVGASISWRESWAPSRAWSPECPWWVRAWAPRQSCTATGCSSRCRLGPAAAKPAAPSCRTGSHTCPAEGPCPVRNNAIAVPRCQCPRWTANAAGAGDWSSRPQVPRSGCTNYAAVAAVRTTLFVGDRTAPVRAWSAAESARPGRVAGRGVVAGGEGGQRLGCSSRGLTRSSAAVDSRCYRRRRPGTGCCYRRFRRHHRRCSGSGGRSGPGGCCLKQKML